MTIGCWGPADSSCLASSLCPPVNSFHVSRWMLLPTATSLVSLSLSLNSPCLGHLAHHCLDSGRCPLIVDCCPLCCCVCPV